jgi:hypothetical protein
VHAGHYICNDFAQRTDDGNPGLAKAHVDLVDHEGGEGVAGEGTEEHAGDDGVGDVVICFKLKPG